ncbi:MAG: AAA family ATPase [Nanoarchaeota archaeon]|nr:AAA family ATPase [Nanoarchaeota archaeon]
MLNIIAGLPGTGKSTIAKHLQKKISGSIILSRDDLMEKLFKPAIYGSKEQKDKTFEKMLSLADSYIKEGKNVILEMPFSHQTEILVAKHVAFVNKEKFNILLCSCSDETSLKRITLQKKTHKAGDRDKKLYFDVKSRFDSIKEKHKIINTDLPLPECINECLSYLKR